jgi:exodeoxyribonuclease VII large subunit
MAILQEQQFYMDKAEQNCQIWASQLISNAHLSLSHIEGKLALLDPKNILKRGFSITLLNGKPLTDSSQAHSGDKIVTLLHEGEVRSLVEV